MIYLASESPRRQDLLRRHQLHFQVIPNLLKEETLPKTCSDLRPFLRKLAAEKVMASKNDYSGLILGVDTSVVLGKEVLGKPADITAAKAMLRRLSGKTHCVISGFCLYDTQKKKAVTRTESAWVTFKKLSEETIDWYCKTYPPLDKAGSYGIQDCPDILIAHLKGSVENVMGLPTRTLKHVLKQWQKRT